MRRVEETDLAFVLSLVDRQGLTVHATSEKSPRYSQNISEWRHEARCERIMRDSEESLRRKMPVGLNFNIERRTDDEQGNQGTIVMNFVTV